MQYTLNQLQIFLKISQTKSITKAAEALNLTQPAVSIQLKNFQSQFDIALTEIIGRKIHITEFGQEVAKAAEQILTQVEAINHKSSMFKNELYGKLKIASVSTGKYVIPYFIGDFIKTNKAVELSLDVTNKKRVIDSLHENTVDFGLVSILPDDLVLNSLELIDNELFLIGSPDFPDHMSCKDLAKQQFLLREIGSGTRFSTESFLNEHNIKLERKLELTSNEAIKQSLIAGLGVSIMPLIGIRKELQTGELKKIHFEDLPIRTKWHLIWLKSKNLSPVAESYVEFVKQNREQIISKKFAVIDQD
jgi:DNA-binding transcriptional LysR family regulator